MPPQPWWASALIAPLLDMLRVLRCQVRTAQTADQAVTGDVCLELWGCQALSDARHVVI